MPLVTRAITPYKPRHPIIDVHTHAFKHHEGFPGMAAKYCPEGVEFPVYGGASIEEAEANRTVHGMAKRIIKNLAVNPDAIRAANDFAIEVARRFPNLVPTGSVHPGSRVNEAEIERLARAGIRGIAFDSCWQGFEVSNPDLRAVYRKISEHGMFILMHTGEDPQAPHKQVETWPGHVKRAKDMAPDSVFIAAHLGANGNFLRAREYAGDSGILLDLAWVYEHIVYMHTVGKEDILNLIYFLGSSRIVYGSDYPWADPGAQLRFWEGAIPGDHWRRIAYENAQRELGLLVNSEPAAT